MGPYFLIQVLLVLILIATIVLKVFKIFSPVNFQTSQVMPGGN